MYVASKSAYRSASVAPARLVVDDVTSNAFAGVWNMISVPHMYVASEDFSNVRRDPDVCRRSIRPASGVCEIVHAAIHTVAVV